VSTVGFMIACSALIDDYPGQRDIIEAMTRSEFDHRYPGAADVSLNWVWCAATSYDDEYGERFEVPAHWGLFIEGQMP
jgi:hypothetical protein